MHYKTKSHTPQINNNENHYNPQRKRCNKKTNKMHTIRCIYIHTIDRIIKTTTHSTPYKKKNLFAIDTVTHKNNWSNYSKKHNRSVRNHSFGKL